MWVANLPGGAAVAVNRTAAAVADDWARAAMIVTLRARRPIAPPRVFDRVTLRGNGAIALIYRNGHFEAACAGFGERRTQYLLNSPTSLP